VYPGVDGELLLPLFCWGHYCRATRTDR